MAPSSIDTGRTSSASSASSSTECSPTSPEPRRGLDRASTVAEGSAPTSKFLDRIHSQARSRSPRPRAATNASANPIPSPAATGLKRSSTDTFRSESASMAPRPRPQKRNSGTTMQVGRHSNDWLFGGFSFTDTVKDLLKHEEGRN